MTAAAIPQWLVWAREIQALAQTSIHFNENHFQEERFTRFQEIAAEIVYQHTQLPESELIRGESQPSYETTAVGFYSRDEIPQPFSGERTNRRNIADNFILIHNPNAETVFD
ncbi:MAG: NUDIX hydrolase N-terminal domain-containing protein [Chloroflexota bacterium]